MISVKTKEHLLRWVKGDMTRVLVTVSCFAAVTAITSLLAQNTKVVEVSDNCGAYGRGIVTNGSLGDVYALANVAEPGQYDEILVSATSREARYHILRAYPVTVTADGKTTELMVTGGDVGDVLESLAISYDSNDEITPAIETKTGHGTQITLRRVEYKEFERQESVPTATEYLYTSLYVYNPDYTWTVRAGQDGLDNVVYREKYVDGEWNSTQEIDRIHLNPMVTTIVKCYADKAPVSCFLGPEVLDGVPVEGVAAVYAARRATAYSAGPNARGASGRHLTYGTVAVNPNIIPYGSLLYIVSTDGSFVYGYAYAADTGIAMMDGRAFVDLYYETYAESLQYGVGSVNVYVLDDETAQKYREKNEAILASDVTVGMQG